MATAPVTIEKLSDRVTRATWALTTANSDGEPLDIRLGDLADRSVHAFGTFGGGTLNWQGSNQDSGSNWANLSEGASATIALTADGAKQVHENTLRMRPLLSGSTGATVTVVAILRRPVSGIGV